jgi:ATP-binding cassette subfamily B (MDR/TAP) protein 6
VSLVLNLLAYPFSLLVVRIERRFLLPSVPTKGHGIVLLLFWTLVFISENLAFFNLDKKQWWFQLKT